jgi:hypothetical protein
LGAVLALAASCFSFAIDPSLAHIYSGVPGYASGNLILDALDGSVVGLFVGVVGLITETTLAELRTAAWVVRITVAWCLANCALTSSTPPQFQIFGWPVKNVYREIDLPCSWDLIRMDASSSFCEYVAVGASAYVFLCLRKRFFRTRIYRHIIESVGERRALGTASTWLIFPAACAAVGYATGIAGDIASAYGGELQTFIIPNALLQLLLGGLIIGVLYAARFSRAQQNRQIWTSVGVSIGLSSFAAFVWSSVVLKLPCAVTLTHGRLTFDYFLQLSPALANGLFADIFMTSLRCFLLFAAAIDLIKGPDMVVDRVELAPAF